MNPIPRRLWQVAGTLGTRPRRPDPICLALSMPALFTDGTDGIAGAYAEGDMTRTFIGGGLEAFAFLLLVPALVFLGRALGRGSETGGWAAQTGVLCGLGYVAVTFAVGFPPGASAMYGVQHGLDVDVAFAINNVRIFGYFLSLLLLGGSTLGFAAAALADRVHPSGSAASGWSPAWRCWLAPAAGRGPAGLGHSRVDGVVRRCRHPDAAPPRVGPTPPFRSARRRCRAVWTRGEAMGAFRVTGARRWPLSRWPVPCTAVGHHRLARPIRRSGDRARRGGVRRGRAGRRARPAGSPGRAAHAARQRCLGGRRGTARGRASPASPGTRLDGVRRWSGCSGPPAAGLAGWCWCWRCRWCSPKAGHPAAGRRRLVAASVATFTAGLAAGAGTARGPAGQRGQPARAPRVVAGGRRPAGDRGPRARVRRAGGGGRGTGAALARRRRAASPAGAGVRSRLRAAPAGASDGCDAAGAALDVRARRRCRCRWRWRWRCSSAGSTTSSLRSAAP